MVKDKGLKVGGLLLGLIGTLIAGGGMHSAQAAAQCGNDAHGFSDWLKETKILAAKKDYGKRALNALDGVNYAQATIKADRNQRSFRLSLQEFMQKRGSATIVTRGRTMKRQHAALFARLEQKYGVPAGPLIAIWGMETAFGSYMGKQHTLSAVATLSYDCRRSAFFTEQLYAILELIDKGHFNPGERGAMHGEIGQTQFLPLNVVKYGVDGDGDGRIDLVKSIPDALASTANFLRAHGWKRNLPYQKGDVNYKAIEAWNKASVYQQAIAIMGKQIDE